MKEIFSKIRNAIASFFTKLGKGKSIALISTCAVLIAAIVCGIIFWPFSSEDANNNSSSKKPTSSASSDKESSDDSSDESSSENIGSSSQASSNHSSTNTTNSNNNTTTNNNASTGTKIFNVSSYGAKGDGVTDDGPAIAKAVTEACKDGSSEKIVQFDANKTYRVKSLPQANSTYKSLMQVIYGNNVSIIGNNTKLLMMAPYSVAYINSSSNIQMSGFVVDYDPKPYAVGTVTSADSGSRKITFNCGYNLGFTGTVKPSTSDYFAFRNRFDERSHFFITEMTNNGGNSYTFTFTNSNNFHNATVGTEFILPVYGASHNSTQVINLGQTENCAFSNITINSAPSFVIGLRRNSGEVTFKNVRLQPASDSNVKLVSWRDGFHIKDNTAKLTWDGCYIGPLGDDAFNLASVTWKVDGYNASTRTVTAIPTEDSKTREGLAAGDEVVFYDPVNNKSYGTATITKIVGGSAVGFQIDKNIDIPAGCLAACYRFNKDFVVKNTYIEGTVRVRSSGIFQNCTFNVFWVRVENDANGIEGPIPKNITFSNCTFTTPYPADTSIFHVGTVTKNNGQGVYKCQNIVLSGCKFQKGTYDVEDGNQLIIK